MTASTCLYEGQQVTVGTDLSRALRDLAANGHERASELKEAADKFDAASVGFYGEPQTVEVKSFMGTWARTRRLYAEATGQSPMAALPGEHDERKDG